MADRWRKDLHLERRHRRLSTRWFARTGEAPGAKGISAFHRSRRCPPRSCSSPSGSDVVAPHPLATACVSMAWPRAGETRCWARPGEGFRIRPCRSPRRVPHRPLLLPRSASPAGRSTRAVSAQRLRANLQGDAAGRQSQVVQGRCSPTWRSTSTPPRCSSTAPRWLTRRSGAARDSPESGDGKASRHRQARRSVIDRAVQLHGGRWCCARAIPVETALPRNPGAAHL